VPVVLTQVTEVPVEQVLLQQQKLGHLVRLAEMVAMVEEV
jgi:hypothetical protein